MLFSDYALPTQFAERRALRREMTFPCELIASRWDEPRPIAVADISPYGIRVRCPELLPVDEEVVICFTPPGETKEFQIFARVVRHAEDDRGRDSDMGLAFLDATSEQMKAIARAISGQPPPLPTWYRRARLGSAPLGSDHPVIPGVIWSDSALRVLDKSWIE